MLQAEKGESAPVAPTNGGRSDREIEVFFDGQCPLCRREIALLRRWDRCGRILFTDIAAPDFQTPPLCPPLDELMAEIHGRLPSGEWLKGVEVFRRLYSAVGFGWLVAPTRLPGIAFGLNQAYRVFAKNRLRWTGRCTDACVVG